VRGRIGLVLLCVGGLAVAAGLLWFAFAPVEANPAKRVAHADKHTPKTSVMRRTPPLTASDKRPRQVGKTMRSIKASMPRDWYAGLPAAERVLGKRIQDAQDSGDRSAVFSAARAALKSGSAEVRQAAVDALSLQDGEETVPLLTKFLSDPDESVASAAYFAWDSAVDGLEGDDKKLDAVKGALTATKSEEHIKSAVSKLEMFDRSRAIRELAELARNGRGPIAAAAKASYETVTGEPFTDWATARLNAISTEREAAEREADSTTN